MAELTVRTRVAMLIAVAIVALGLGYFLWPSSAPEPTGRAMGFVDTPAERSNSKKCSARAACDWSSPKRSMRC